MGDVCRPCRMSISDLKPTNNRPSSKEEDLVKVSSRRSMTLSDDGPGVMSISEL